MTKFEPNDATGTPVVIGGTYIYAQSTNGWASCLLGVVEDIHYNSGTPFAKLSVRARWSGGSQASPDSIKRKTANVKTINLVKAHEDYY